MRIVVVALSILLAVESFVLYKTGIFDLTPYNFQATSDYVRAQGSWISDTNRGFIAETPVNAVEIFCDRTLGYCMEARAYKHRNLTGSLLSQLFQYKITRWTPEEVVALLDGGAGTIELRFDIRKKIVTMTEAEKTEHEGARELPAYAHLGPDRDRLLLLGSGSNGRNS